MISDANALVAAVSNEGRLLVFPISELPELARGKGNKIINIPGSRLQAREEFVIDYGVISEGDSLVVHSGKRYLVMKAKDLEHYRGERGRRGHKLPRGFQKVDKLEVEGK
jgi:topoisomerase-4 subunit A